MMLIPREKKLSWATNDMFWFISAFSNKSDGLLAYYDYLNEIICHICQQLYRAPDHADGPADEAASLPLLTG